MTDQELTGKCIDMIVLQASLISEEYLNTILNDPELLDSLIDEMKAKIKNGGAEK